MRFCSQLHVVPVGGDQALLLCIAEAGVLKDLGHEIVLAVLIEDPRAYVERLGGDLQGLGDLLQDLGRGFAEPPFDL
jgi:hypothetical protein